MVKYFENKTTFHYNWDQVAQGFWRRYPNPESTHVLSEDIIDQKVCGDTLFTKRMLTKTNKVPKWGERFVKSTSLKMVEESVCNPKEKTLVTYTRNIGYVSVMSGWEMEKSCKTWLEDYKQRRDLPTLTSQNVVEKVEYKVSDENKNWTVANRSVWIDSKIYGFSLAIQNLGLDRYKKNIVKMTKGFNFILNAMFPHVLQQNMSNNVTVANPNYAINPEKLKTKAKQVTSDLANKSSTLLKAPNPS